MISEKGFFVVTKGCFSAVSTVSYLLRMENHTIFAQWHNFFPKMENASFLVLDMTTFQQSKTFLFWWLGTRSKSLLLVRNFCSQNRIENEIVTVTFKCIPSFHAKIRKCVSLILLCTTSSFFCWPEKWSFNCKLKKNRELECKSKFYAWRLILLANLNNAIEVESTLLQDVRLREVKFWQGARLRIDNIRTNHFSNIFFLSRFDFLNNFTL